MVCNKIGEILLLVMYIMFDVLFVQVLLWEMVDVGCDYVFMEVSFYVVYQWCIVGFDFDGVVFINIMYDYFDYYKIFKAYIEAKKMFFDMLFDIVFVLVNVDDCWGEVML